MRHRVIILLALLLLASGGSAWGAVRTVGSGQSYATIQAAVDAAVAGDVVSVRTAQTYNEQVTLKTSGTSAARISLRNDSGGEVTVSSGASPVLRLGGTSYWTIQGLTLRGSGGTVVGNSSSSCHHITLENCGLYREGGSGTILDIVSGDYTVVQDCYLMAQGGSGSGIRMARCSDSVIRGSEITGASAVEPSTLGDGLMVTGQRIVIENNYLHNSLAPHNDGIVVQGWNSSYPNTGDVTVRNNIVKDFGGGAGSIYFDAVWGDFTGTNLVYNNLIHLTPEFVASGGRGHGINIDGENVSGSGGYFKTPVRIYNNTIRVSQGALHISRCSGGLKVIKNNVVLRLAGTSGNPMYNDSDDTDPANWDVDYNCFDSAWSGRDYRWGSSTYSYAEWTALGCNAHGLQATASLDASFKPQATSNTVDKGTSLSTVFGTDLAGVTRPQGPAWDLGAYEYAAGPSPQQPPAVTGVVVTPE
jgi:hypothetical protein